MHRFLRAVGFRENPQSEQAMEQLLDDLFHSFDERTVVREIDGQSAYIEMTKSYGPNIGLCLSGQMDADGFHRIAYYPYLKGTGITTREEVTIEKSCDGRYYLGMADEGRVGLSLIFHLQNAARYKKALTDFMGDDAITSLTLSALASSGMILLPMKANDRENRLSRVQYYERHDSLVEQAKRGNEEAIESLTLEDMDTYAMITRRLLHEDIYTIVDSSFMPSGLQSDQYQIVGSILFYTKVRNTLTKEYIYQMTLDCNGMRFDVCINEKDLLGDPEVGRRFKGKVWMQGKISYS